MTVSQTLSFLLFWLSTNRLYINVFILENAVINLIIPLVLLVAEFYLHIAYSGIPSLSNRHKDRVSALNGVIFFWAIGRIIQGTAGIIAYLNNTSILTYVTDNVQQSSNDSYFQDLLIPALFLIDAFICEIIPLFLILDSKKLDLFLLNSEIENFLLRQGLMNDEIGLKNLEEQEKRNKRIEVNSPMIESKHIFNQKIIPLR